MTSPRVFFSADRSLPAGPCPRADAHVGAVSGANTGAYVFLGCAFVAAIAFAKGAGGLALAVAGAGLLAGALLEGSGS